MQVIKYTMAMTLVSLVLFVTGCKSTSPKNVQVGLPEMVYIPAGDFLQGDMTAQDSSASPVRTVNISEFLISSTEVTISQWNQCVKDKKCDALEQNDNRYLQHPVVNISVEQAQQYIDWLADVSGKSVRFPTESEWEYAAKGGKPTLYGITNKPEKVCRHANVGDINANLAKSDNLPFPCDDNSMGLANVKSYIPNLFGLYDMLGNAAEITQDCWTPDYQKAPTNGDAVATKKCMASVVRGGTFQSGLSELNSHIRKPLLRQEKNTNTGFRVALSVKKGLLDFDFKSLIE